MEGISQLLIDKMMLFMETLSEVSNCLLSGCFLALEVRKNFF